MEELIEKHNLIIISEEIITFQNKIASFIKSKSKEVKSEKT